MVRITKIEPAQLRRLIMFGCIKKHHDHLNQIVYDVGEVKTALAHAKK